MRTIAAALMLIGTLWACAPLPSVNLADLMRAGDPVPLIGGFATLGRTIDLSRLSQVRAAIGNLQGVSVSNDGPMSSGGAGITRYRFPAGEIIYNPDAGGQYFLLAVLKSCVPIQFIRERLRSPEFLQPRSRITVALYTDVPYVNRRLNAFTYLLEGGPPCISNFGIAQWKYDPWHET